VSFARTQGIVFLLALIAAQWLACLHGVSHVSAPDDQVCSQCLHGKPKQHTAPPALAAATTAPAGAAPQHPGHGELRHFLPPAPQPRGPPTTA
jgi:hypothetical protein